MKYDEIEQKVQSYRWLEGIAKEYREMIDRIHAEKEYFRVEKIAYTARGDMRYFDLNCGRRGVLQFMGSQRVGHN